MSKCVIENCNNEAIKHGLCEKDLRNKWYKAGYLRGVYKINFKNSDKFYIGMAFDEGFNQRFSKHKNYLIKDYIRHPNEEKTLLKYFNQLCDENKDLSRKAVFEKYVDNNYEILNGMYPFNPIDIDENSLSFNKEKDRQRESYKFFESKDPKVIKAIDEMRAFIKRRERDAILQAKKIDNENNTHNCLNDNI